MKLHYLLLISCLFCACTSERASLPEKEKVKDPFNKIAFKFLDNQQADSAFYYFDKAKEFYMKRKDSLQIAGAYINMAITQFEYNDYYGSQESSIEAIPYLDTIDQTSRSYLSMNYNTLGNSSDEINMPEKAIHYYQQAIRFASETSQIAVYQNNLALSYRAIGKKREALELLKSSLEKSEYGTLDYARTLSNIASTRSSLGDSTNVLKDLHLALQIREKEQSRIGMNSSYALLSDYYVGKNQDSAMYYAQKRYATAQQLNLASDKMKGLKQLIALQPDQNNNDYFKKYLQIQDSLNTAHAITRNQFALIRYEAEKSKAENLQLQKDKVLVEKSLVWQRAGIAFLLTTGLYALLWFIRHRKRQALLMENRIKESQLKTSKKVHDVVANGIYRVMIEIEHQDQLEKEHLLDQLEDMYHKSRDISHDRELESEEGANNRRAFHEQVGDLIKSFANEHCKVLLVGNEPETWKGISKRFKQELLNGFQELMVNMSKHSEASTVLFRFERNAGMLLIQYSDNGIGVENELEGKDGNRYYGKGLKNTVSRMESLHGQITFESRKGEGFKCRIEIPVKD